MDSTGAMVFSEPAEMPAAAIRNTTSVASRGSRVLPWVRPSTRNTTWSCASACSVRAPPSSAPMALDSVAPQMPA